METGNYNINKIIFNSSVESVWKRVGSGTFTSTNDRRLYHLKFGNRYVLKVPGFEKVFSSNVGMVKESYLHPETGDLYLLRDVNIVKFARAPGYNRPETIAGGAAEQVFPSKFGTLIQINGRISLLDETAGTYETIVESSMGFKPISGSHILTENSKGEFKIYDLQRRKVAFSLPSLLATIGEMTCHDLGKSFLLSRHETSMLSRLDRILLEFEESEGPLN
ncbi:hypothetical protein [Oligoflexus tunisiensis]|uniref:hypothetical protein n=1 Tax=Oligoflexus tunisiensis TaxID=708132 RepID=UPI00114CECE4|nr:hypothetical protein [Oligoflexus tunisiensis]